MMTSTVKARVDGRITYDDIDRIDEIVDDLDDLDDFV